MSSHVVRGTVGNRAAALALEALGFPVWVVPTVTLAWHPGQGPSTRLVPDEDAFAALVGDLATSPLLAEVGGIITGYFGAPWQVAHAARLVKSLKAQNSDVLFTLDPVIGDAGRLYVPDDQACAIREDLLPLSDLTTPNMFELSWLSGRGNVITLSDVDQASAALPVENVLTTSAPVGRPEQIGNRLTGAGKTLSAIHETLSPVPHGLGDLTGALMTGHMLDGLLPQEALHRTTASVLHAARQAQAGQGADARMIELVLENDLAALAEPPDLASVEISENTI